MAGPGIIHGATPNLTRTQEDKEIIRLDYLAMMESANSFLGMDPNSEAYQEAYLKMIQKFKGLQEKYKTYDEVRRAAQCITKDYNKARSDRKMPSIEGVRKCLSDSLPTEQKNYNRLTLRYAFGLEKLQQGTQRVYELSAGANFAGEDLGQGVVGGFLGFTENERLRVGVQGYGVFSLLGLNEFLRPLGGGIGGEGKAYIEIGPGGEVNAGLDVGVRFELAKFYFLGAQMVLGYSFGVFMIHSGDNDPTTSQFLTLHTPLGKDVDRPGVFPERLGYRTLFNSANNIDAAGFIIDLPKVPIIDEVAYMPAIVRHEVKDQPSLYGAGILIQAGSRLIPDVLTLSVYTTLYKEVTEAGYRGEGVPGVPVSGPSGGLGLEAGFSLLGGSEDNPVKIGFTGSINTRDGEFLPGLEVQVEPSVLKKMDFRTNVNLHFTPGGEGKGIDAVSVDVFNPTRLKTGLDLMGVVLKEAYIDGGARFVSDGRAGVRYGLGFTALTLGDENSSLFRLGDVGFWGALMYGGGEFKPEVGIDAAVVDFEMKLANNNIIQAGFGGGYIFHRSDDGKVDWVSEDRPAIPYVQLSVGGQINLEDYFGNFF